MHSHSLDLADQKLQDALLRAHQVMEQGKDELAKLKDAACRSTFKKAKKGRSDSAQLRREETLIRLFGSKEAVRQFMNGTEPPTCDSDDTCEQGFDDA